MVVGPRCKNPNYGLHDAGPSHVRSVRPAGGRGRRGVPHVPSLDDELMNEVKSREVIMEESIAVEELANTPIPQQILEMGWERVVIPRINANMTIVREFYYHIKRGTYRTEGVVVRGVRVRFDPNILNKFFRTPNFPNYLNGFPYTSDYEYHMSMDVYRQLRMYPIARKYKNKVYRLDHSELSTDLAFWNDFVSHTISPRKYYQRLPSDHGRILTAINRAEQFDIGIIMCLSLDWHLSHKQQIVFPCTITALCQLAGIDVRNVHEDIRCQPHPMGGGTFARMANTRADPGYLEVEHEEEECDDANDSGRNDRIINVLDEMVANQRNIIERLDGNDRRLQSVESSVSDMASRLTIIEGHLRVAANVRDNVQ